MEFLLNLLLSFWGVVLSLWFKSATSSRSGPFSWAIAWQENKRALLITGVTLILTVPGFSLFPEMAYMISLVTGLNLNYTESSVPINLAPFTYGHLLYSLIRNQQKPKNEIEP